MKSTTTPCLMRDLFLTTALGLTALLPVLGNCAGLFQSTREWKEEVKLSSGQVLTIDRVEFIGRRVPLIERTQIRLKFSHGKAVSWESCALPIAMDWVDGKLYVIGRAEFKFCAKELETYEPAGFAAWTTSGVDFKRINVESVPTNIAPNLVYDGKAALAIGRPVRYNEKLGDLHVLAGINWCKEKWRVGGSLEKCDKKGAK